MAKSCIFEVDKLCINCGECNKCDLNSNKQCNNCGKCLELEGYDSKIINIDEILEEGELENFEVDLSEVNDEKNKCSNLEVLASVNEGLAESDVKIEYIDDVDGLSELLEDEESSKIINEVFPGLVTINKIKK